MNDTIVRRSQPKRPVVASLSRMDVSLVSPVIRKQRKFSQVTCAVSIFP